MSESNPEPWIERNLFRIVLVAYGAAIALTIFLLL